MRTGKKGLPPPHALHPCPIWIWLPHLWLPQYLVARVVQSGSGDNRLVMGRTREKVIVKLGTVESSIIEIAQMEWTVHWEEDNQSDNVNGKT